MSNELERLIPLLKRWSEQAPVECEDNEAFYDSLSAEDQEGYDLTYEGYGEIMFKGKSIIVDSESIAIDGEEVNEATGLLLLEGAIREAIELRGWAWDCGVNWFCDGDKLVFYKEAKVWIPEDLNDEDSESRSFDEVTEDCFSEAEALLSAYVRALEAQ